MPTTRLMSSFEADPDKAFLASVSVGMEKAEKAQKMDVRYDDTA